MSNHLISLAYTRDLRTSMRKAMLVLMADKASDDGSGIWAAKQTMADELCCSKQTVIDTIKGFITEGLVRECGQRKSPNGYTVEYHINIAAVEALPMVKCHADKGSRKLTGQSAGPVKEADLTSQPAGPKPSRTPHSSEAKASSPKSVEWHPLPDAWVPTRTLSANTQSCVDSWPPGALESELESFRAWAANAQPVRGKGLKKDWNDAFGNWIRSQHRDRYSRQQQRHQSDIRPRSRLLDALAAADEAIARSAFDEDHAGAWLALPPARTG
jgi:hypothetical protein